MEKGISLKKGFVGSFWCKEMNAIFPKQKKKSFHQKIYCGARSLAEKVTNFLSKQWVLVGLRYRCLHQSYVNP